MNDVKENVLVEKINKRKVMKKPPSKQRWNEGKQIVKIGRKEVTEVKEVSQGRKQVKEGSKEGSKEASLKKKEGRTEGRKEVKVRRRVRYLAQTDRCKS